MKSSPPEAPLKAPDKAPEALLKAPDKVARAWLEERLRPLGTPERAAGGKAYLKSELEFYGATVWQIRAAVKDLVAERARLGHDEVVALAAELWAHPVHEFRMAAVVLMERNTGLLSASDLDFVEGLVRGSKTWAYVDGLACDVAGGIVLRDPTGTRPVLDRWAADTDFWVRRSALLSHLLPLRQGAPWAFAQFTGYADGMLEEKEFFIRKSIGWVLREAGKRRPELVVEWLAPRTHRASGVTMREAVKYVDAVDRDRLLLAYRGRRPAAEVAR